MEHQKSQARASCFSALFLLSIFIGSAAAQDPRAATASGQSTHAGTSWEAAVGAIANIQSFLEQCPTNDPNYAQIRSDLTLLRDGMPVGALACAEPISQLPLGQYTDELIVLQGLRVIYYMDQGRSGHLP